MNLRFNFWFINTQLSHSPLLLVLLSSGAARLIQMGSQLQNPRVHHGNTCTPGICKSYSLVCVQLKEKPMTNPTSSDLANFISSGAKQHGYATTRTTPVYESCSLKLLSPVKHKRVLRKTNLDEVAQLTQPNPADLCNSACSRSKMLPNGTAATAAIALQSTLRY